MAKLGFRKYQEMVGRTDKLFFNPPEHNKKAHMLDFSAMLKNALEMRPNTNIVGGSVAQFFDLKKRLVSREKSLSVLASVVTETAQQNI